MEYLLNIEKIGKFTYLGNSDGKTRLPVIISDCGEVSNQDYHQYDQKEIFDAVEHSEHAH